jgi:hypothetical protein
MSRFLSNSRPEEYIGGAAGAGYDYTMENKPKSGSSSSRTTSSQTKSSSSEQAQLDKELRSQRDVTPFPIEVRASRTSGRVNFRVGPSASTARITLYPDGKELMCTGETTNWYRAYDPDNGNYGYIHKNYVTVVVRPEPVPVETTDSLGTLNVNGGRGIEKRFISSHVNVSRALLPAHAGCSYS